MESSRPLVAIYGSSAVGETDSAYRLARELGAELARAGAGVMSGGYGGVMEACSRGAAEAGGHVIGVTVGPSREAKPANEWVTERVHTRDLFERLGVLAGRADAFVAVGGSLGTLTEVFLTWTLLGTRARPSAPLVLLGSDWRAVIQAHRDAGYIDPELFALVQISDRAQEAARLVLTGHSAQPRP